MRSGATVRSGPPRRTPAGGGRSPPGVVAAFTRDLDEHRARLRRLTASPERLEVRSARYSERELEAIYNRLASDTRWLDEEGVDGDRVQIEIVATGY
jgi:hypothetical protein